jgi:hypothetical protein
VAGRLTGGAYFGYENGTAMVTLGGMMGREPPTDRAEMLSFVEEFAPAAMLAALRAGEPLGEVARYSVPSNQWRRYDKMLESFECRFPMTGSVEPTSRAVRDFSACETASTRSAGRCRWPAPPRGPLSSLSFR